MCSSVQRFLKGTCSTDFEDEIDTSTICELEHFFVPVGCGIVVDDVLRTELLSKFELFVRGGSSDDGCAGCDSKLEAVAKQKYCSRK